MIKEQLVKELKQDISDTKYAMRTTDLFGDKIQFDQFLSRKNYLNIRGLHYFSLKHKELQGWQIEDLIKQNKDEFKFLNDFVCTIDDVIDEMRVHGALYGVMAYQYKQAIIKNKEKLK